MTQHLNVLSTDPQTGELNPCGLIGFPVNTYSIGQWRLPLPGYTFFSNALVNQQIEDL
ncbi:hypothetical protein [Photobacterium leiognathi]|uniref:hypothetical protein n=1 Tax=Photobacterium leiognathi TaxID=553611 RepID=UPI002736F41C|nr:hypothetical protein [Photobacterium leiognathi]